MRESSLSRATPPGWIAQVGKAYPVLLVGYLASRGLEFFLHVIVARSTSVEGFGLFTLSMNVFGLGLTIAGFGLAITVVRLASPLMAAGRYPEARLWTAITCLWGLVISVLVGGAIGFLAPVIARWFDTPELYRFLLLAGVAIPPSAMVVLLARVTAIQGEQHSDVLIRMVLRPVLTLVGVAIVFSFMGSVSFVFLAIAASGVVCCGVLAIVGRRLFLFNLEALFSAKYHFAILGGGSTVMISALAIVLLLRIDRFLLGILAEPADLGVYSAAASIGLALHAIAGGSAATAIGPAAASLVASGSSGVLVKTSRGVAYRTLGVLFIPWLICFVIPEVPLSIYGPDYHLGAMALRVLATCMLIIVPGVQMRDMLAMAGHSMYEILNSIVGLVVIVLATYLLIPELGGVDGAALSVSLGLIVVGVLRIVECRAILNVQPYDPRFLVVVAGLVVVGVIGVGVEEAGRVLWKMHYVAGGIWILICLSVVGLLFRGSISEMLRTFARKQNARSSGL